MKQRGAIMVLTLLVLTGLVAILAAAAATQRMAFKAGSNRLAERRTEITADAACQYVIATLATQSKTATTLQDDWASLGTAGNEKLTFGDQSFRIEVIDAASRININTLSAAQMQMMNFSQDQMDSLQDWRQAGQTPRPNGAKDAYYNALPQPYNTSLRSLNTVDELLLVKGFTSADLFKTLDQQEGIAGTAGATSTSSTTTSSNGTTTAPTPVLYDLVTVDSVSNDVGTGGRPKSAINSPATNILTLIRMGLPPNLAAAIIQRRLSGRPFTTMGQVLALPGVNNRTAATILDNLSITGAATIAGRLDLNTVTADVLNTVPNVTPDIVQAIIQQQQTGFTSLGQLASVSGITTSELQSLADLFAVNSQTFIVHIVAEAGDIQKAYEATISIAGTSPKVIRMTEAPSDAETRWGWSNDTSTVTPVDGGATQ